MIRINLLPAREGKRRILLRRQLQLAVVVVLLAVAGGGWLTYTQYEKQAELVSQGGRLDAEIAALESIIKEVEKIKQRSARVEKQIESIKTLHANQRRPALLLDALSRSLPEKVWLVNTKETGQRVEITGKSLNGMIGIAAFMENIGRSPWFGTAEIIEAKSEIILDREVQAFTIKVPITTPKKQQPTS